MLAVARQLTFRPVGQLQVGFREADGADSVALLGTLHGIRLQLQQCWEGERGREKAQCEGLLRISGQDDGEGEGLEGEAALVWVSVMRSRV